MRNPITDLRLVGALEGVSFLLLLGVAMPMKYIAGMPLAVRMAGAVHGVFFVIYVAAVLRAARVQRWPLIRVVEAVVASIYPLGTFFLDRKWREEERMLRRQPSGVQEESAVNAAAQKGGR